MNAPNRFREVAVEQGPHTARLIASEAKDGVRCTCGAKAVQVTIDRRSGSLHGRCTAHQESAPRSISEMKRELAMAEQELAADRKRFA